MRILAAPSAALLALALGLALGCAPRAGSSDASSDTPPRPRLVVDGVDLTGIGYDAGAPDAPVVVVELSDFGCPYCAQFATRTAPALQREFVDSGRVRWKHVPFLAGEFRHGERAAAAAECAGAQGRFWEAKQAIFAAQRAWSTAADPDAVLARVVGATGLDERRFAECYARREGRGRTAHATAAARRLGVRATPTFLVDGRRLEGAVPLAVFRGGLRSLLERVDSAGRAAGAPPRSPER